MRNPWLDIPAQDYEGHMASPPVTPTPYTSLESLVPLMKLVNVEVFSKLCSHHGLAQVKAQEIPLKHGKALFIGYYSCQSNLEWLD